MSTEKWRERRWRIFSTDPYVSFANCGLPYYVGNTIPDRDDLLLQTPERFWKRFRVRVHVLHEVLHIDRTAKCVQVKNLMTQEITSHPYDTLILAPGAGAIMKLTFLLPDSFHLMN
ncbi:hypothetical protein [Candidatus Nitrospira neomarina]|uniref:Uncharacterized protein n=1 Tax=Candidatus Nitrospira neomarina TaxID=3020899 RepID=A0AA96GJ55_9BACT|nr:hypothetical protein [Candidatus Nitrospira neomarina]WNM61300.1 hypothetical protein PQG83_16300 [Candidatus Nitrospira neomarina]